MRYKQDKTGKKLVTKNNTKLIDFMKEKPNKSNLIICSCGARYSSKLDHCPKCGLVCESKEEIENWKKI